MKQNGRSEERLRRAAMNTRSLYEAYPYPRIDGTDLSVEETVDEILKLLHLITHPRSG